MLKLLNFFKDAVDELKKLQIPSKKETYVMTITILTTMVIASLAILFADFVISKIIGIVFSL